VWHCAADLSRLEKVETQAAVAVRSPRDAARNVSVEWRVIAAAATSGCGGDGLGCLGISPPPLCDGYGVSVWIMVVYRDAHGCVDGADGSIPWAWLGRGCCEATGLDTSGSCLVSCV